MRVLQCSPCVAAVSGGPAFVVAETAEMLRSRGHAVQIATTDQLMSDSESATKVEGQHVFRSVGGRRVAFSPGHFWWTVRKTRHFDIVHIHGYQQPVSMAGIAVCVATRTPFVFAPHGTLGRYELSRGSRAKRAAVVTLRTMLALAPRHAVLCTTESEQSELPRWAGRAVVSPIPVEPTTTPKDSADAEAGSARPFILHMGRIAEKKGLIRTARFLADSSLDFDFVVAGDSTNPEAQSIVSAVQSILGDRARFVGHASGHEKAKLLHDASCLALLSDDENFAVAVAEALVVGTPVLISERVGLASCVAEIGGGVVVEGNGAAVRVFDLVEAVSLRQDRDRIAQSATAWFAPARIVAELEAIYRELSGGS